MLRRVRTLLPAATVALAIVAAAVALSVAAPAAGRPAIPPSERVDASAPTAPSPSTPAACRGLDDAEVSSAPARFPTRTEGDVLAAVSRDPWTRRLFNDLAGVRPGPLRDPRVPECRPDLLVLADPTFVRRYPATTGTWLVPVRYEGTTLLTMFVGRDADGLGSVGGNRGGAVTIPPEAVARALGGIAGDPVVSAEIVFANASCGRDLVVWRLVRKSGTAVYLVPEFPRVPPPGALLTEREVYFTPSGGRPPAALAMLSLAC